MTKQKYSKSISPKINPTIISTCIALFALIISLLAFINQRNQNAKYNAHIEKIDSLSYKIAANDFQPKLKIIEEVSKNSAQIELTIPKKCLAPEKVSFDSTGNLVATERGPYCVTDVPTVEVKSTIKITAEYKVTNVGNSTAIIVAYAFADSVYSKPFLRQKMLSIDFSKISYSTFPDFYKNQLLPGDTTIIPLDYVVQFNKEGKIITHCVIFYENDLGHLYDTYFWIVYENIPQNFLSYVMFRKIKEGLEVSSAIIPEDKNKIPIARIANQSYYNYDYKTALKLKSYFGES